MNIDVVVPAAGIGRRMNSALPKQYLKIGGRTVLERTLDVFLSYPRVSKIIVCLRDDDDYFSSLACSADPKVIRAAGGEERVDSVLSGLGLVSTPWVMVHDAARPCLTHEDLDLLIGKVSDGCGGILGTPVRDTMKRTDQELNITGTVERSLLFHALTPQMFRTSELKESIKKALAAGWNITDEASAMEYAGFRPLLVEGRSDNIKITRPSDLALAEFILNRSGLNDN